VDPFDEVRAEPDPLKRAKRAGELIMLYRQRSVELARLRKVAINQLAQDRNLTFTEVARLLGLTKGRVAQIRQGAPPKEREFFGIGPVTVAVPLRASAEREHPVIASEDSRAREMLQTLLLSLAFDVRSYDIPADGRWEPRGDVVAICGPKSSPVTAIAIESDPVLSFEPDESGRWVIRERATGKEYRSGRDDPRPTWSDVAYVARLPAQYGPLLVIAGVHALGSVGAVDYLIGHLPDLYATVGTRPFSMVVYSEHDGDRVTSSKAVMPACVHE
jgi:hypothetical protein